MADNFIDTLVAKKLHFSTIGKTLRDCYFERVIQRKGCWDWLGSVDHDGYGLLSYRRVVYRAHRLSYELLKEPIPDGLWVLHRCDNPRCSNPDHLFLGTAIDNVADKTAKDRQAAGSRNGRAKLTEDNVRLIRALYRRDILRSCSKLAKKFNVSTPAILNALKGPGWKHVEGVIPASLIDVNKRRTQFRSKLSDQDRAAIREQLKAGIPAVRIYRRYKVSPSYISLIKSGKR